MVKVLTGSQGIHPDWGDGVLHTPRRPTHCEKTKEEPRSPTQGDRGFKFTQN